MPLSLLNGTPIPVTSTVPAGAGFIGAFSGANGISQCYAPVAFGGALYVCWQGAGHTVDFTPQGGIFVSRSDDNGATWNVLDVANGPTRTTSDCQPCGGCFFDGAKITVAYSITAEAITPTLGGIRFRDFILATQTWGADYGIAGAPACYEVHALWKRAAGDMLVFFSDTSSGGFIVGVEAAPFSAGAWGVTFAVDANISPGVVVVDSCSTVMDATGAIHVTGTTNPGPGQNLWYQRITPANALGSFVAALQTNPAGNVNGAGISRQIAVGGDYLAIGSMDTFGNSGSPILIYGTPLSAPVFTIGTPFDPAAPIPTAQTSNPELAFFRARWYAVYYVLDPSTLVWQLRALEGSATPAGPWSPAVTVSQAPAGPWFPSQLGIGVFGSTLGIMAGYAPTSGGGEPRQSMVTMAISGPGTPGAAITGGLPYPLRQGRCTTPNLYADCLEAEAARVSRITWPPSCILPPGVDPNELPWDEEGGAFPEQSYPISQVGSIVTPAPGALNLVTSFLMPTGYDGLLTGIVFQYTGQGFEEGSGDILFYLQKGLRYLKDLANVPYTLGAIDTPVPLTEGQILQSGQRVSILVSVPNLSGNIQVGANRIFAQMMGIRWPRG